MVVLVTGCRSGIGLRTAETLARAGHTVYAGLRDVQTAQDLRAATAGLAVHPVQLDVTDPDERERAVAGIEARHGALDALVNNAGVARRGPLETFTEAELRQMLDVNVVGLWALTARVLPAMRARRRGTVVQVSSVAGRWGLPTLGAYAATKHAVTGMTEALRLEVQPFGVRVCLIEPGPHKTEIFGRNERRTAACEDPDSPYRFLVERMDALAAKAEEGAGDPQDVADRILAAVEATDPPLWNAFGPHVPTRRFLRWLLPGTLYERVIQRMIWGGRPPVVG